VIRGRRTRGGAVLFVVLTCLPPVGACGRPVDGAPTAGEGEPPPATADELGALIVTRVPSGLPRLSDDGMMPPAGAKHVEDVAGYSDDPARERAVLEDYGYRHGWERFWGSVDGPVTGVLVDQFDTRAGAGAYAEDLARNDAELYRGMLREDPDGLPGGCWLLTVEDPDPERLHGPAAFVWCVHGVFSVSATAIDDSVDAAEEEVRAVLAEQLERLPPS
jgi:hypothetical protein